MSQATGKSKGTSESQLDVILNAIARVRETVEERMTMVEEGMVQIPTIEEMASNVQRKWIVFPHSR